MNPVDKFDILNLFTKLRKEGLPLILDDYQLALDALANPAPTFNLHSWESVVQLCRRLWVKTREQNRIFDNCLEQIIPQWSTSKLKGKEKTARENTLKSTISTSAENSGTTSPNQTPLPPPKTPDLPQEKVVKTIGRIAKPDHNYIPLKVSKTYLPASPQQMRQSWLTLHYPQFAGIPTEIDIDATIAQVKKAGIFFEPVIVPPQQPRLELLLLIDRQGSMVPFHGLARQLIETAVVGGHFGKIEKYYFENYPDDDIYLDPECWQSKRIGWLLSRQNLQQTSVLIFSDAGAARGKFNPKRLQATELFLRKLKRDCPVIIWLNPLPKERWQKTTAEDIANLSPLVTMFECHRRGFANAIAHLRGEKRSR
ncbi:MAG: hypothetical protein RLZZ338_3031 [Cyanobacteriota bacterium]|jgi:uncharacterized protein with von Willebrand factor type A (vWA) domain